MTDPQGEPDDTEALVAGTRLRCDQCGSEIIVLNTASANVTCCGESLAVTFDGETRASSGPESQA